MKRRGSQASARLDDGPTVLVAGPTGRLGSRITHHLLNQPSTTVHLLVRPGTTGDPLKREALASWRRRGAVVVETDLSDATALEAATAGVDVVVSALEGGHEVIVKGQLALAEAAASGGAQRILPSDFNLDLFRGAPGEHADSDLRREADERIAGTGLEHVHVLTGVFMDNLLRPRFLGLLDHKRRTATYWGTGKEPFDATTREDTAKITARVAVDPAIGSGTFAISAEQLTLAHAVGVLEATTGRVWTRRSLGTVDGLRAKIATALDAGNSLRDVADDAQRLRMFTGTARLRNLQVDRYPDIRLQHFEGLAREVMSGDWAGRR